MTFLHDNSMNFTDLKQVNLPSGRCYQVETGEHIGQVFPSITRMLGKKEKPQLEAWKVKKGPERAAYESAVATVQGSKLHNLQECFLNNEELPRYGPNVGELWGYLRPWLAKNVQTVYAREQNVYSFQLGLAGRLDLLAGVNGELVVLDTKSTKRPRKAEWNSDYFCQGTFYALAIYETTKRVVKKIILPVVSPEGIEIFESTPAKHYEELRARIKISTTPMQKTS